MKIGIMADTHDNLPNIKKSVNLFNQEKVDLVFHAGDFVSPFTARELKNIKCPFTGVFGNNDGDRQFLLNQFKDIGPIYPEPYKTKIDGKEIIMFHKNDVINDLAKSQVYNVIIYGHTHQVDSFKEGKTTVINPGECGGWLTGESTIAILNTATLSADIIRI
jgi:hypothetical protein